jgi:hypothetical protein
VPVEWQEIDIDVDVLFGVVPSTGNDVMPPALRLRMAGLTDQEWR